MGELALPSHMGNRPGPTHGLYVSSMTQGCQQGSSEEGQDDKVVI